MRVRSAVWWAWGVAFAQATSCGGQTSLGTSAAVDHGRAGTDSAVGAATGGAGNGGTVESNGGVIASNGGASAGKGGAGAGNGGGNGGVVSNSRDASVDSGSSGGAQGTGGKRGSGAECETSYDCRFTDARAFPACDPSSGSCVPPCAGWARDFEFAEPTVPCASGQRCIFEEREFRLYVGACYTECDWTTGGKNCPSGLACGRRATSIDRCPPGFDCSVASSLCKRSTPAGQGEQCAESDTSTGCKAGYYCQGSVCRLPCDFWSDAPACAPGEQCAWIGAPEGFPGICDIDFAQDAQLWQPCTVYSAHCASDGKAWRGQCMDACSTLNCPGGPRLCLKHCRTDADCPSDFPSCTHTVCAPR